MPALRLNILPGLYSVCQLGPGLPCVVGEPFVSLIRTSAETSVVCREGAEPAGAVIESGWRIIEFAGPFAFSETGILASVAGPLGEAGIGIFALSTFNTDYVLVKDADLDAATAALAAAGHRITSL